MPTPYKSVIEEIVENINRISKFDFDINKSVQIFRKNDINNKYFIMKHNISYTLDRKYSENNLQEVYSEYNIN